MRNTIAALVSFLVVGCCLVIGLALMSTDRVAAQSEGEGEVEVSFEGEFGESILALDDATNLLTHASGQSSIIDTGMEPRLTAELDRFSYDLVTQNIATYDGLMDISTVMACETAHAKQTATVLNDGKILVIGGETGGIATSSAAVFDPTTGTAAVVSGLAGPRSGHTATLLDDGRVLVVGGTDGSGSVGAVEVYDPAANAFSAAGQLSHPRYAHTATLLGNGNVLIVGGTDGVSDLASMELFDAANNSITLLAVALTEARQGHAAATINKPPDVDPPANIPAEVTLGQDGNPLPPTDLPAPTEIADGNLIEKSHSTPEVVIYVVGGRSAGAATASVEVVDLELGTVTAGPPLQAARYNHTATVDFQESLVVIGGSDGTALVPRVELLPVDGTAWTSAANALHAPRQGHSTVLLPSNGHLLVVGGIGVDGPESEIEAMNPLGVLNPAGTLSTARGDSAVAVGNGNIYVVGGLDSLAAPAASLEAFSYPVLFTPLLDYGANEDVPFTGTGWMPGETVLIRIVESDGTTPTVLTVTADANGEFSTEEFNTGLENLDVWFTVTAVGQSSGHAAWTSFTDSHVIWAVYPDWTGTFCGNTGNNVWLVIYGANFHEGTNYIVMDGNWYGVYYYNENYIATTIPAYRWTVGNHSVNVYQSKTCQNCHWATQYCCWGCNWSWRCFCYRDTCCGEDLGHCGWWYHCHDYDCSHWTNQVDFTISDCTPPTVTCQNAQVDLDWNGNGTLQWWQVAAAYSDNVGACNAWVSPSAFSCANRGWNYVTLYVQDCAGNVGSCGAWVNVVDGVAPYISCKNAVVALDANGQASISTDTVNNGVWDACGISSAWLSNSWFTCGNRGNNTVTLYTSDTTGNVSACNANVTVVDNISPSVLTKNITIQLNASGQASISANDVNNGSSDACGVASMLVAPTAFTCGNVGPNTVTLTVADTSGNAASGTAVVTVQDTVAPSAAAKNITVYLDATGNISIAAPDVNNGSVDACGIATMSVTPNVFTCGNVGDNAVALSVTDVNGNTSSAVAVVTVVDDVEPAAVAQNITIQLDAFGNASIEAADVNNGSSDACGIASMTVAPDIFACANVGANVVTLTVTDVNGNVASAAALVTVEDNVPPVAVARDITVQLDASGSASIAAADVDNGSNDACGIASLTVTPDAFTCATVGANPVTLTVTDVNGNVASAAALVTVEDNVPPVAVAQDITVQLDASGNASIAAADVDNGGSDACGISSMSVTPEAFTCANVGANPVTLTVTDTNGNVSTAAALVTVEDKVPPAAAAKDITVQLDATGNASITTSDVDNGSSDACGIASMSADPNAFTCASVGGNTVTLTVTDVNGNVSTAAAQVTVEDKVPPAAVAKDITVQLDATGNASITASDVDNGSSDACGIASMSVDPNAFTCASVGGNTVTLTVSDVNGNVSAAAALVTVEDKVPPAAVAKDITVQLDATGKASITASDVDNGSSDACGIASMSVDPSAFTCANVGDNTVTLTVTDMNGNVSAVTAVVTVEDKVAPTVTTKDAVVQLSADGQASITAADIDNGSWDACGIASITLDKTAFTCADFPSAMVTLTVTDVNGNSATGTATVTVQDVTAPLTSDTVATPNPVAINKSVVISATVTDLCTNIMSAEYSVDGGLTWLPMDPIAAPALSVTVLVTLPGFTVSDILTVCVRGTDSGGNTSLEECIFLPVYDPSGGFVTGGGWIDSPAGAYAADPTLTGKANFGFVSKYQKGSSIPTGSTEFHFQAGDLNFHSSTYEWLVISGAKATYKGTGIVNGSRTCKFFLSAIDGALRRDGIDTFRIRIFDDVDGVEQMIYDNLMAAPVDADPTTVLGGGSIVIHKK